jgi:3D-(3,5/4)-trihydroxycyclohexane-1,2-dione acylhydrolase (decyclizing)
LPVLCLPSDIFASRRTGPVLQQVESPGSWDFSVNDSFRAVSKYWDRINRPDQLPTALLEAMRTLTSPADTGAVTLALPQDVQAEAWDFPTQLFRERTWHVPRARADRAALRRAAQVIAAAKRPVIIAGGGVIYSAATAELADLAAKTGIPVGVTQAGKASLHWQHPQMVNAIGASGSMFANSLANQADVIIGIGTRYTDFTTASNTLFTFPQVQFININVAELDAYKEAALALVGDARETILELGDLLGDYSVDPAYRAEAEKAADDWRAEVERIIEVQNAPTLSQAEAIGLVNAAAGPRDVVVNAAGSMPGDLHRLWRPGDFKGYDLEYGNSCMGYEIAGALGAKMADPSRGVWCFIGDGTFLLASQEIMTAVQERLKITVLLVDNYGYGSIAALSETRGSQGFGCRFNYRGDDGQFSDERLDIDLAANAASYGADVFTANTAEELAKALADAAATENTAVISIKVDPKGRFGGSGAWWDVPVSEVSELESTQEARRDYEEQVARQRLYL